jgi:hypothetical protein
MSNPSYSSEHPPFSYAVTFKDALFDNLYVRQIEYWNDRLRKASKKNVECYSREDAAFNNDDRSFVALFYDGEVFGLLPADEDDDLPSPYCLEVYGSDPDLLADMEILCEALRKFKRERYIAQRFLSGLTVFEPPPKVLRKILGDGLYRICHNAFEAVEPPEAYIKFHEMDWEVSEPEALDTYVREQQSIIVAMQERMMLNMITL